MEYSKEYLSGGIYVCTSKEHTFGTDAILLADFANPTAKTKAVDFGSGCGIIPFFFHSRGKCDTIYAVEIQKQGYEQIKLAADDQKIDKIIPIHADLKELKDKLPFGQFDLVTMNPPYKQLGGGVMSSSESDKIARHESAANIYDIALSASKLLKFGGRICMCQRPERLCDTIDALRKADCEPKRIRFVHQRVGEAPWLFLIEGKRGRKPDIITEPPLYIEEKGDYSEEYRRIYREYQG